MSPPHVAEPEADSAVRPHGSPPAPPRADRATPGSLGGRVAAGEARAVPVALTILAVIACGAVLYFGRVVFVPLAFSVVLAALLRPTVRWLARHRVPTMLASGLVVGAAAALIVVGLTLVLEPARAWVAEIPQSLREAQHELNAIRDSAAGISEASEEIERITEAPGEDRPVPVELKQRGLGNDLLGTTGTLVASGVTCLVLTFFLLSRIDNLMDAVLHFLDCPDRRAGARAGLKRVEAAISRYLLTVSLINFGLGVAVGLAMWALRMPNPVLWGVMAALLNYVPFVGAWVGAVVIGFVALLTFDSAAYMLLPPMVFVTLTTLEGNVVTPTVLGQSMSLDPYVVFLSLLLWGWMWGVAGAILAVPMLAIALAVCEQFESSRPVAMLISGRPTGVGRRR